MDAAQTLFGFIANPNVAYVLLILGLTSLVFAFSAPGTGLAEVAAVLCLVLAGIGLSRLPVNLAGVLLIALGIGLFLLDIKLQTGYVALGGAVALGAGSLFLFRPDERAITVSWWLIALSTLGTSALFGLGVNRAVRAMRMPSRMSGAALIGRRGVLKTIATEGSQYTGTALIGSELWTVKSEQPLSVGATIVVERVEGLVLGVKHV